jgi:hypothetical protein
LLWQALLLLLLPPELAGHTADLLRCFLLLHGAEVLQHMTHRRVSY